MVRGKGEDVSSLILSLPAALRPRRLVVFFVLALVISWSAWVPLALASREAQPAAPRATAIAFLGACGPLLAALITAGLTEGRAGLGTLFRRLLIWRVGLRWYLFVLCWPALLSLVKTAVHVALGGAAPDFAHPPFVQYYPLPEQLRTLSPFVLLFPVFVQQTLVGSSMGEEPGWRGYALPRLQARCGALWASVILGVVWGAWHLPLALAQGRLTTPGAVASVVLGPLPYAALFTWVYHNARGSLLLALLFHSAIAVTGLFLSSANTALPIDTVLNWGVAALVIAALPRRTRGAAGR